MNCGMVLLHYKNNSFHTFSAKIFGIWIFSSYIYIMKKVTIDSVYAQAREVLKEGRVDEARDLADYGIVMAAEAQEEGLGMDDELEGVRIGLWLERFWYFLENNNLMLA